MKFKVKNFLSFKEEIVLDFEATGDKDMEMSHIVQVRPGVRILKLGVLYGPNASGKSNLVRAFSFLQYFWFTTKKNRDEKINVIPFLLDKKSANEPTRFSLEFFTGKKKYVYSLKLDSLKVVSETLVHYPGMRPAVIFDRKTDNGISSIKFSPKLGIGKTVREEMNVKCLRNMSVFAAYDQVNAQIPELENVFGWMKHKFMPPISPKTYLDRYAKDKLLREKELTGFMLDYLKNADFNIADINVENEERGFIEKKGDISERRILRIPKAVFTHRVLGEDGKEDFFELPEKLQSRGTVRIMGIAAAIRQSMKADAFLAIDEIESSLHPKLTEFVIEDFLKKSTGAQLFLTTHYDSLLEERDLLRKDNIWFVSKRKDASTELYSLSDFRGLNRISSLKKAYRYGKFGAIPNI